jgi:hypothetical protein
VLQISTLMYLHHIHHVSTKSLTSQCDQASGRMTHVTTDLPRTYVLEMSHAVTNDTTLLPKHQLHKALTGVAGLHKRCW